MITQDNDFTDLQKKLSDMIGSLELVPYQPTQLAEFETITFEGTEKDFFMWKALVAKHISTARNFEIHCWTEEMEEISIALQYETVKPINWEYGTVIEGCVTQAFKNMLINFPKPPNTMNGCNKMTPFFSIIFDNGFSSEHYGTENHIKLR